MNKLLVLILAAILVVSTGCTSVPLSTIAKMSTFDWQDFNALNASELEVQITIPQGFKLNIDNSWLGVDIGSDNNHHSGRFLLKSLEVVKTYKDIGLFHDDAAVTRYTLALADASLFDFKRLQDYLSTHKAKDVAIRVVPKIKKYPHDLDKIQIWIDLKLSQKEGYFTLIDGADLSLENLNNNHSEDHR